ncbi:MAG: DUF1553 domain-containing protein [Planctomycetaceae bacterium]|nr:DUF1553 domain-containing protein [Planctomycetaceae bacterium]
MQCSPLRFQRYPELTGRFVVVQLQMPHKNVGLNGSHPLQAKRLNSGPAASNDYLVDGTVCPIIAIGDRCGEQESPARRHLTFAANPMRIKSMSRLFASLLFTIVIGVPLRGASADDEGLEFFEKKIRPVLVEHCQECHSAGAKKLGGGLLLDHREGIRKGGDSGKAVEPGKPDESLLIEAIRYADDALKMPPKGKLPASVIADFETWVRRGAPDPRETPGPSESAESWEETLRRRSNWWSLQTVRKPAVPQPKNDAWSQHPVDRFLLARLEEQRLTPAEPADRHTLARRLSLVVTGLPPDPQQLSSLSRGIEPFVESLLASPHFGERWARHWLDVVRFSETHGNEWNYEVHHAWRYRDYLIRAFNANLPYDQFVREHIAGDLLEKPRWNAEGRFNESPIGTGFYRFGEVNHDDCISLRSIGYDLVDNQIDTLTKAFQATTVACARCHNHKLDAVSTDDYYALLGVLRSSRQVSHCIDAREVNAEPLQRLRDLKAELRTQFAPLWLHEARQLAPYMRAAQARRAKAVDADDLAAGLDPVRFEKWLAILATEKLPLEDPFEPWRILVGAAATDPAAFSGEWRKLAEQVGKEDRDRTEFNQSQFVSFADFRGPDVDDWQLGGQAFREPATRSGDFALHADGEAAVRAILPAGRFTHSLSDKLNGTLRSPVLPTGKKKISFQVMGQRSSAVRLVSNNCQLNYANYRALTSGELQWVTFSPPDDRDSLRTYAELMTMFDNPKFPDQLSPLGGDKENYRLPWDKAAANPRSYFGITRAVLHDAPESPRPEVTHLLPLFAGNEPQSLGDFSTHYVATIESALKAWADDKATDDDVRWLDALLRRELLGNGIRPTPRIEALMTEYRQIEAALSVPRVIAGMSDGGPGFEQPVFVRGDCTRPGDTVPRRYLEVLSKSLDPFTSSGSGRIELAERIAGADNPLTARVMVNRVWHHLFGTGLVRTVDDFGHVGELPSHPELLDFLAARFVEEGWSVKWLIRELVLTRTFGLSSRPSQAAQEIDPLNRLLQHYPARRMEAEAVRDSILAASGRLDLSLFGPSVQPYREKEYADRRLFPGPLDGNGRRSIYIKNNLMEAPKFLAAFNFPGGKVAQGRRDVTNVPAQALALLNDPFVLQQAEVWAARLVARDDDSIATRIAAMFEAGLGRLPTADEQLRFEQSILQFADLYQVSTADVLSNQLLWKDVAHTLFNMNEFIYIP